jgi:hypothetical protein
MTAPTFRPTDEAGYSDDMPLTHEHGRRLAYNAHAVTNERALQVGHGFIRTRDGATALRTLWRSPAQWGFIGPIWVWVPGLAVDSDAPFIRLIVEYAQVSQPTPTRAEVWMAGYNRTAQRLDLRALDTECLNGGGGRTFVSTADGDYAAVLEVPATGGWNELWLGVKCVGDEVTNQGYFYNIVAVQGLARVPVVETSTAGVPSDLALGIGFSVDGPQDAERSSVLSVAMQDATGDSFLLWDIAPGAPADLSNGAHTHMIPVAQIQSISVSMAPGITESRSAFGGPFRPFQFPSATTHRGPLLMSDSAHDARMPMVSAVQPIENQPPTGALFSRGVPRWWNWYTNSAAWERVRGAAVMAHTGAQQELPPSSARGLEAQVSLCAVFVRTDPAIAGTRDRPAVIAARLVTVVDGTATAGPEEVVELTILPIGESSLSRAASVSVLVDQASNEGNLFGCEGLSTRDDIPLWLTITLTAPITQQTAGARVYLELQTRASDDPTTAVALLGVYPIVGHMGVRYLP